MIISEGLNVDFYYSAVFGHIELVKDLIAPPVRNGASAQTSHGGTQ